MRGSILSTTSETARRQRGQSMVEYTVVVAFFCLTLTSEPMLNVIQQLSDTIKERFRHYSYVVSLSDYPDTSVWDEARKLLRAQLEEEGYDPDEINEILHVMVDGPDAWADALQNFVNESFPRPDGFPDINPLDFF